MSLPDFSLFSDAELKVMADDVYEDLIDAAEHCRNTPWHDAVFAAMWVICEEMQSRCMAPPVTYH